MCRAIGKIYKHNKSSLKFKTVHDGRLISLGKGRTVPQSVFDTLLNSRFL